MDQKKRSNLCVKQKLELAEKPDLGVYVTGICEEYEHLDLTGIRQYRTTSPPQLVR